MKSLRAHNKGKNPLTLDRKAHEEEQTTQSATATSLLPCAVLDNTFHLISQQPKAMSLNESLTDKLLRLRKASEAAEAGYIVMPCRKRKKTSQRATDTKADDGAQEVDHEFQALLRSYKAATEQCKQDVEKKQNEFHAFKQQVEDLKAAYLYGLQKVSALKDLQDAPDAILFGNFPQTTTTTTTKEENVKDESAT